jgi:hypothetical protein
MDEWMISTVAEVRLAGIVVANISKADEQGFKGIGAPWPIKVAGQDEQGSVICPFPLRHSDFPFAFPLPIRSGRETFKPRGLRVARLLQVDVSGDKLNQGRRQREPMTRRRASCAEH